MSKMTTADKILLVGGILFVIDVFLPWNRVCVSFAGIGACGSVSGFHGLGIINFLLALVIVVMEILVLANVNVDVGTPQMRNQIEAYVAFALGAMTIIKILVDLTAIYLFAWVGLALAIVIAYGGFMRLQESKASPPPAQGGGTGGFTG